MNKPLDNLIPTPAQRAERDNPTLARVKIVGWHLLARAGSIQYSNPATDEGLELRTAAHRILRQLEAEGPNPVYDRLIADKHFDPLLAREMRERETWHRKMSLSVYALGRAEG